MFLALSVKGVTLEFPFLNISARVAIPQLLLFALILILFFIFLIPDEEKRSKKLLKDAKSSLKGFSSKVPLQFFNSRLQVPDINPASEMSFGHELKEIADMNINEVLLPSEGMEHEIWDEKVKEGCVEYETTARKKDGSLLLVSVSAVPVLLKNSSSGT